jgi:hypothetical protein
MSYQSQQSDLLIDVHGGGLRGLTLRRLGYRLLGMGFEVGGWVDWEWVGGVGWLHCFRTAARQALKLPSRECIEP